MNSILRNCIYTCSKKFIGMQYQVNSITTCIPDKTLLYAYIGISSVHLNLRYLKYLLVPPVWFVGIREH